jgi:hypothetical protein
MTGSSGAADLASATAGATEVIAAIRWANVRDEAGFN